jgi:hypothetical protein
LFTDERHENDRAKLLFLKFIFALAGQLEQHLVTLFLADGNNQATAWRKLLLERGGYLGPACRNQDRIEGRRLRPAARAVAGPQFDIVIPEVLESLPRGAGERWMALDPRRSIAWT